MTSSLTSKGGYSMHDKASSSRGNGTRVAVPLDRLGPKIGRMLFGSSRTWQTSKKAENLSRLEELTDEQREIIETFVDMLLLPTLDGGNKRARGTKVSWKTDPTHVAAAFRHLDPSRETFDSDSRAHKYVHAAWRLLAAAYQQGWKEVSR